MQEPWPSAAKQSILSLCGEMDCFASLAMTADTTSHSRGASRPKFCISLSLINTEGAGKTGCAPHPRSRAQNCASNTRTSIQVWRKPPAFPAQWLYGLYVIVLVTGFLATIISVGFRFRQLDAS